MKISELVSSSKLSGFQILAISVAIVLTILEGYDSAMIAFVVPYINSPTAPHFTMNPGMTGTVVAGALIGIVVGSVFVAPVADKIGRRGIAIVGTFIVAIGMIISPLADNMTALLWCRILTGFGLGALLSVVGVTAAEYSNRKVYRFVMAVYAAGINVGAVVGSLVVGPILKDTNDWRIAFYIGTGLSLVSIVLALIAFPESLSWLATHRSEKSLTRLNRILTRMGHEALTELPPDSRIPEDRRGALRTVFSSRLVVQTLLMIVGYVVFLFVFYFMNALGPNTVAGAHQIPNPVPQPTTPLPGPPWTPTIANAALAPTTTLMLGLGGIVGTLLFGILTSKINPRILTPVFLVLGAAGIVVFGNVLTGDSEGGYFTELFFTAFFFSAGVAGFYQIVPALFPTHARSTGNGIIIGLGRVGGIFGPILATNAVNAGWSIPTLFTVFGLPLLISALTVVVLAAVESSRRKRGLEVPVDELAAPAAA